MKLMGLSFSNVFYVFCHGNGYGLFSGQYIQQLKTIIESHTLQENSDDVQIDDDD